MITKQLRIELSEMQESGIQDRAEALSTWLYADKKETFLEVLAYVALQADLIENLTRELADLRKEENPIQRKFFPMSTTARKRT